MIVGTCSNCGGPVQVPDHWASVLPAVPTCAQCGAVVDTKLPVLPMRPRVGFQVTTRSGVSAGPFVPPNLYVQEPQSGE